MTTDTELTEVTAKQWGAIRADLEKLLSAEQKDGEPLADYARRLARAASDPKKITDDAWETLDDLTQKWVNGANSLDEKGEPVPLPPGSETSAPPAAGEGAPAGDTAAPAAKAPKRKAPAAKPAREPEKKAPAKKVPAKKKVPEKKPAAKQAPAEKSRGRPTLFQDTDVIHIKKKEPFRAGTASAIGFSKIRDGATVAKAVTAGTPRRLIRWAKICEYIDVRAAK